MEALGDYRLRRRLAVGGMGEVYLGEKFGPEGFVKPVVLKCVRPNLAQDDAFIRLFLEEARLAGLLNHPNIAQIYDFGVADGVYFMAMEYVAGYTVEDLRRKHQLIDRFLPIEHVASIASQACQGLQYAHALTDRAHVGLGLVHRDVSPQNLIVSLDGAVKVLDFGIAKARGGVARIEARGAVGKFGYMSPEQARGEPVDARTDVFSLGVCMWELLTNRRLHEDTLESAPAYEVSNPLPAISTFRSDIPGALDRIVRQAVAIDPQQRFVSCQAMHLELERLQAALTHYAGQAALADYIQALIDGRVENPPVTALVAPHPPAPREPPRPLPSSKTLQVVERYEAVFSNPAPEDPVGRVPQSWIRRSVVQRLEPKPVSERARKPEPPRPPPPRGGVGGPRHGRPYSWGLLICVLVSVGAYLMFRKPAPVAVTAPQRARYSISTVPAGANVKVDAEVLGVAPLVVELDVGAPTRIELSKSGFATKRLVLDPAPGTARTLAFELAKAGTLVVHSTPQGAEIALEGVWIVGAKTPFTFKDVATSRPVRVAVRLPNGTELRRTVHVKPRGRKTLRFQPERSRLQAKLPDTAATLDTKSGHH